LPSAATLWEATMRANHEAPPVADIMAYEAGELDAAGERHLFQRLVDSGLAWKLQGHYGRTAAAMIKAGEITAPTMDASPERRDAMERAAWAKEA
jgi:hypothetical protein